MATGTSSFDEAIKYALERLASGHLTLKKEQLKAIRVIYDRRVCATRFGKCLCYKAMDHKLGLSRMSESSSVLLCSLS